MNCPYCDCGMFHWGSCYECHNCRIRWFDLEGGRIYQIWTENWCALPGEGILIVKREAAV